MKQAVTILLFLFTTSQLCLCSRYVSRHGTNCGVVVYEDEGFLPLTNPTALEKNVTIPSPYFLTYVEVTVDSSTVPNINYVKDKQHVSIFVVDPYSMKPLSVSYKIIGKGLSPPK